MSRKSEVSESSTHSDRLETKWKIGDTRKLIDFYREHQSLWNSRMSYYPDRELHMQLREEIGVTLNRTPSQIKMKWGNLRSNYRRTYLEKKPYVYAKELSFLESIFCKRAGRACEPSADSSVNMYSETDIPMKSELVLSDDERSISSSEPQLDIQENDSTETTRADGAESCYEQEISEGENTGKEVPTTGGEKVDPMERYRIFGHYVAEELKCLQFNANRNLLIRRIQKAIWEVGKIDDGMVKRRRDN